MSKKTIAILFLLLAAGVYAGWRPVRATWQHEHAAATTAAPAQAQRKVLYWIDAMHPAYKSDKPGKAPDCGMDLVPVYADEGPAPASMPPGTVQIGPAKLQLIGVQYGEVAHGTLQKTLRTVGRLAYDETRLARIHTKIEGWIEQVQVDFVGKEVKKNQPLLTLYSPDLFSTEQEFLIAKKAKDYLGGNSNREIAANALSLYDVTRERLRLWDVTDEQIREIEQRGAPMRALTLYAPLDGFVVARNAYPKQRITPETELYLIADLSTIWVLADVYEYELPMIHVGAPATMTLSYFPGRSFAGKITYIYPQVDNTTRTAKVRLEFPNPDLTFKPDMYADIELQIDYGKQMSVPSEAVLDSGTEQIVFVARGEGYFEPRKVAVGAKVDDRTIILSGLKPGEKIVTSGNFLIDSESRLKSAMSAMAGMEQPAAPAAPEHRH